MSLFWSLLIKYLKWIVQVYPNTLFDMSKLNLLIRRSLLVFDAFRGILRKFRQTRHWGFKVCQKNFKNSRSDVLVLPFLTEFWTPRAVRDKKAWFWFRWCEFKSAFAFFAFCISQSTLSFNSIFCVLFHCKLSHLLQNLKRSHPSSQALFDFVSQLFSLIIGLTQVHY